MSENLSIRNRVSDFATQVHQVAGSRFRNTEADKMIVQLDYFTGYRARNRAARSSKAECLDGFGFILQYQHIHIRLWLIVLLRLKVNASQLSRSSRESQNVILGSGQFIHVKASFGTS